MFVQILLVILTCNIFCEISEVDLFEDFVSTYSKSFKNLEEKEKRFEIFKQNLKVINLLNLEDTKSNVYGINEFTDKSRSEFKGSKLMLNVQDTKEFELLRPAKEAKQNFETPAPDYWNWNEHGAVTKIKNQESCGSCWSFSTTGNIEGKHFLSKKELVSLSEEQLVECDDNKDCGCLGGLPYRAMQWLIKNRSGKILKDSSYPYCVPPIGDCYACVYSEYWCGELYYCNVTCHDHVNITEADVGATIRDYEILPKNESYIKEYLYNSGPISILMDASLLQYYHSGIYNPIICDKSSLDHAILLVGYGTEKTWHGKEDYWIVKNSWGEKWGEKGFFKLKRGDDKCGVAEQAVSAII